MRIPMYQVDAFASRLFTGNPAAVCPLDRWLDDATMQAIAGENNLSETAFYVPAGKDRFGLRWFTPTIEVDLCGHATLGTAHVVFEIRREVTGDTVTFESRSGELRVKREGGLLTLDFPSRPATQDAIDARLVDALGAAPSKILGAQDYLCIYETEEQVRALAPNMEKLAQVDRFAVIVTAPGKDCDFVSRFFAPSKGVPEDPVTGRAHCTLTPYWAERLGKTKLHARQLSKRGGELWCELRGDRVKIAGRALQYLEGSIEIGTNYPDAATAGASKFEAVGRC
jgi:PhzF family phenazine biosynthesis protein